MPHNADQPRFQAVVNNHAPSGENTLSRQSVVRLPIDAAIVKASFRRQEFDDFELDYMPCGRIFTYVALIDIGDLDCFAGLELRPPGKFRDLGLILFIRGCHAQRERMPERIDYQMDLTAIPVFGSILVGASAALGRRSQDPAIKVLGPRAFFVRLDDQ